jgi:glutamate synthase (NADPH/NADH) large chain
MPTGIACARISAAQSPRSTAPSTRKGGPEALREAIKRIRYEAEQAVRAGCTELFLTDEHLGVDKVAIAGVLAAAAVHTHLVRRGLRSYAASTSAPPNASTRIITRC